MVELFRRTEYPPEKANGAIVATSQAGRIVSKIPAEIHPTSGYWIDWGGTYDTPESNIMQVYFDLFLSLAETIAQMIFSGSSMFRGTGCLYIVTDKFPWQYIEEQTELSEAEGYSTAVPDTNNPSNDMLDGRHYPVRMEIPSLEIKLPDSISGSALQLDTFTINLLNQDGFFDITELNNFFNSPIFVLKSFVDNPLYSDFSIIRRGFNDDFKTSFGQFEVTAATIFRALSEDVNKTVNSTDYPSAPTDSLGKKIPIVWGSRDGLDVINVVTDTYVIIDPDYISSIDAVYDSDGVVIPSSDYSLIGGLLVMDPLTATPSTADVTGSASNNIGQIIVDEIQDKSRILYAPEIWDTDETDAYILSAHDVNLFFEDGTVRELVAELLKSDNAFLIEKSDGRLSLRKWGNAYQEHIIKSWVITQKPEKKYVDSKYYVTRARVLFPGGQYEDGSQEEQIAETYRKKQTREYATVLSSLAEAQALATDMLSRYGQRAEVWTVPIGVNTAEMSLLDKVRLDLVVNDRTLSNKNSFLVIAVDVAQDVLTLEAIGTIIVTGGLLSTPSGVGYSGDMSGPLDDGESIMPELLNREDL